jgi:hypothetical protein
VGQKCPALVNTFAHKKEVKGGRNAKSGPRWPAFVRLAIPSLAEIVTREFWEEAGTGAPCFLQTNDGKRVGAAK